MDTSSKFSLINDKDLVSLEEKIVLLSEIQKKITCYKSLQNCVEPTVVLIKLINESLNNFSGDIQRLNKNYRILIDLRLDIVEYHVKTCLNFTKPLKSSTYLKKDTVYIFASPARIDLFGTWTDLPPICYEKGGLVIGASVTLTKKILPISVTMQLINESCMIYENVGVNCRELIRLDEFEDFDNFWDINKPGSLFKCCVLYTGLVNRNSNMSIRQQILKNYGCSLGLKFTTSSTLPMGSGLGTSTIMIGCILASLYRLAGFDININSLLHHILYIEQMLKTRGGWQDQVHGLISGHFKVAKSSNNLPLKIEYERIGCSQEIIKLFQRHLFLVYTGVSRVAKNIVEKTIIHYDLNKNIITSEINQLMNDHDVMTQAIKNGDIKLFGECLNHNQRFKNIISPDSFPAICRHIIQIFEDLILGSSICGAGGGGFMIIIVKQNVVMNDLREKLNLSIKNHQTDPEMYTNLRNIELHNVELCESGLSFEEFKIS